MARTLPTRGEIAFNEWRRIRLENGRKTKQWSCLTHVDRLAFQAMAQRVAELVSKAEAAANDYVKKTSQASKEGWESRRASESKAARLDQIGDDDEGEVD